MGWKTLRDGFGIDAIVQVRDGNVCIGSAYVADLITVRPDGSIRCDDLLRRDDRKRPWIARLLAADPLERRACLDADDVFTASIPVFTYEGGRIVEDVCEVVGWPNCTHGGAIMYDNQHSPDKATVVEWAKANARAGISLTTDSIEQTEAKLARIKAHRAECEANLAQLEADYPSLHTENANQ